MDLRERAHTWFEALRDRLCAAFERLEVEYRGPECEGLPAGRFVRRPWDRADGGKQGEFPGCCPHRRISEAPHGT